MEYLQAARTDIQGIISRIDKKKNQNIKITENIQPLIKNIQGKDVGLYDIYSSQIFVEAQIHAESINKHIINRISDNRVVEGRNELEIENDDFTFLRNLLQIQSNEVINKKENISKEQFFVTSPSEISQHNLSTPSKEFLDQFAEELEGLKSSEEQISFITGFLSSILDSRILSEKVEKPKEKEEEKKEIKNEQKQIEEQNYEKKEEKNKIAENKEVFNEKIQLIKNTILTPPTSDFITSTSIVSNVQEVFGKPIIGMKDQGGDDINAYLLKREEILKNQEESKEQETERLQLENQIDGLIYDLTAKLGLNVEDYEDDKIEEKKEEEDETHIKGLSTEDQQLQKKIQDLLKQKY
ncbi:MAG: hypothetical protein EZS28_007248 [Streblomastix strix]|uniref:Uncharacterized protein n=1 Tax=Streblomastix strix TaxID=222440 RepID=A0A5J4WR16_9EUKA|nr:MAG: hypothetical protein EZS28_007248 [Streblomastix strix]